jgi:hypothetical protein
MTDPCQCQPPSVRAVEVLGVYDGVLFFECTTCRAAWHRFPDGDWRHTKAVPFVERDAQPARIGGTEA